MAKVLIVAEHAHGKLNPSTAKCVTCAKQMSAGAIDILVLSDAPDAVAAAAAKLDGVARVRTVSNAANGHALAAALAPQVVALAGEYTHVLGPSTTFGKDLMPRVAGLLGVAQVSDVMKAYDAHTFDRPIYAGNAIQTVEAPKDKTLVATVRTASYAAAGPGGATAPIEAASVSAEMPSHTRFVELKEGKSDRPDLQSASRVVSGGRAFGSAENFQQLYRLADKLNAAVGASRAAVDAGYAPNELQVGQTGKIVAPELYIAIGISGAIQHLTGIKDAGTIVAINKDAEAPIFEIADIGLVGDWTKVLPELEQAL